MHVRSIMSESLITISKKTTVAEALELMRKHNIRRLPVMENEKLIGIVTDRDLSEVSPSPATSLSVFEINYLLAKMNIENALPKSQKVFTIDQEAYIEEAALIMKENKISGLPVIKDEKLIGIVTETDIFDAFVDLLGVREATSRLTIEIEEVDDKPGVIADVTKYIKEIGESITRIAVFKDNGKSFITIRLKTEKVEPVVEVLKDKGYNIHAYKSFAEYIV